MSHTLNAFVDQVECELAVKEFKHALTRMKINDVIEHRFSLSSFLGGNNLALDVSMFFNERELLLRVIRKLCTNQDGSRNRMVCKYFLKEDQSMIQTSERI